MPDDARMRAEEIVPVRTGSDSTREAVVEAVAEDLRTEAERPPAAGFVQRYVNIPCPSGKHQRSMLTFRSQRVGLLFCPYCDHGWTMPIDHHALRDISLDSR